MKKLILLTLICISFIFITIPCKAQATHEALKEDYSRAGCLFHSYEFNEINDSKAPKGFKPFYISHYGRHGSRFHTTESVFVEALHALKAAQEGSNLTDDGIYLLKQIDSLYKMHEGMWGTLAPKGVREQQELARRLAGRFPEVFKGKDAKKVECYSSDFPRCIVSLAAYSGSLSAQYPKLNFSYESGERCSRHLRVEHGHIESKTYFRQLMHKDTEESCDWNSAMKIIFTDPSKVNISPYKMSSQIWGAWAICQCVEDVHIDIFKYFTPEQLLNTWKFSSIHYHNMFVRSEKFGEASAMTASALMEDFINKADAALTSGNIAATIRFGHDNTLLPLASLFGIDEFDELHSEADPITAKWDVGKHMCMASSIHLVFYRNKAEKVLVKIMFNEKETTIPALTPYSGCYYDWTALREHMLSKTASCL